MSDLVITPRYGSRTAAGGGGGVSGGGGAGGGVDNFSKYFEIVNEGTAEELIKAKFPLHSINDIVAFSDGTGGGTAPSIPLATYATTGVVKVDPNTMTVDAAGMIAVKGDLFNLSNYYDKSASDGRFAAVSHTHTISQIADIANASVASAAKLTTARTIALTGGVAGSGTFDGSGNLSIATTLRALVAADIPSLDWAKITTGKPTTLGGYGITDAIKNTGGTIAGDLTITGNLYLQQDSKYIVTEKVYSENDFITMRYNNPSLLAAGAYTGFEAKKVFADGTDGYLVFGSDGMARVGKQASLQMLATREDAPLDGGVAVWSASSKRFNAVGGYYHSGNLNRSDTDFTARNINGISRSDGAAGLIDLQNTTNFGYAYSTKVITLKGTDEIYGITNDYASDDSATLSIVANQGGGNIRFYVGRDGNGKAKRALSINADLSSVFFGAISTPANKFRGPDGNVKWTAQVSAAGDYLEFYNASGVLEMRLSQAGKIQVRDDVEAFSNFS